jgi:hypothetical protein
VSRGAIKPHSLLVFLKRVHMPTMYFFNLTKDTKAVKNYLALLLILVKRVNLKTFLSDSLLDPSLKLNHVGVSWI